MLLPVFFLLRPMPVVLQGDAKHGLDALGPGDFCLAVVDRGLGVLVRLAPSLLEFLDPPLQIRLQHIIGFDRELDPLVHEINMLAYLFGDHHFGSHEPSGGRSCSCAAFFGESRPYCH